MKNIKYKPRTTKYLILLPLFIILLGIALYFYRIHSGISDGFTAFANIEFGICSPLILIFGGIVLFFIILGAQGWENKMNKLSSEQRQRELRNKVIKNFREEENREKKHTRFYIVAGILSLTAYVLTVSNNASGNYSEAKELILFGAGGVLTLITQTVKLWKLIKYSKLQKLKIYGKSIQGEILEITKKGKGFLRDDTMRYQILAQSEATGEKYKSLKTRFNIPFYLNKGDKILIYINDKSPQEYFLDIESAFNFEEK